MAIEIKKDYLSTDIFQPTNLVVEYNILPVEIWKGGMFKKIPFVESTIDGFEFPLIIFNKEPNLNEILKGELYNYNDFFILDYPPHTEFVEVRYYVVDDLIEDEMILNVERDKNKFNFIINGVFWNAGWNTAFYYKDQDEIVIEKPDMKQVLLGNIYFNKIQDMTFQRVKIYKIEIDVRPTEYDYQSAEYDNRSLTTFDNNSTFIRDFFTISIEIPQVINNNYEEVKELVKKYYEDVKNASSN
jgi:hypothetical protein